MILELKKLSENDGKDIYQMLQEIESNDNGFMNDVKGMPYENFSHWLKRNVEFSDGTNLPDGYVPQTTFWLYHNTKPIGIGRIQHYLNEVLKENGGHIGYAIASSCRGRGYGNDILRLLLIECKNMGIDEILVDPYKYNESSNKVILFNGGKLIKETDTKNYYFIKT